MILNIFIFILPEIQSPYIQETLGNSINILLKHFEKQLSEKSSLTTLLCGENGLVHSLENVFQFGFKSYKLFKKLYIWDFLGQCWFWFNSQMRPQSPNYSKKRFEFVFFCFQKKLQANTKPSYIPTKT